MILSKETEQEIRQIYQAYWDAYLSGDFETFASFLDDNIVIYGTAVGEIFTTKEDALQFYTATSEEMTGKAEFRNREIRIVPVGDTVVIYELSQLYILIEEKWTFYGFARITGIFENKGNQWKLVHQHGSFPDSRTEEGQQIASEKIKEENLQLREAVNRRTVELESKTRELEIESSLERVRAVAMSMRQPNDMLHVCQVISEQIQLLGIKNIRNVQTAIIDDHGKGTYMNYQYFTQYGEGSVEEVVIAKHPAVKDMIEHMQQSPDAFFNHSFVGVELEEWKQYRNKEGQHLDPILEAASAVHFYFYSIGEGGLGLSVYTPLSDEELSVFHRFRNVFSLAYQRFRDIEQAEEQAREAQIALALERVRARTMAMQHSDELKEVIQVVYGQFLDLNINIEHTGFIIDYKERDDMYIWLADQFMSPFQITIPYFDSPHWNSFIEAKENKNDFFTNHLNFEQKNKFYEDLFKLIPGLPEESKQSIFSKPGLAISTVLLDNVGLYIENFSGTPYTDEDNATLMRFGKVFQQTYTRFLDLQKAEAQAREAKIEAGLERVRSRSLAMHHTAELQSVIHSVHQELLKLNLSISGGSFIVINSEIDNELHCWGSGGTADTSDEIHIPRFDKPFYTRLLDGITRGPGFFTEEYTREEKIAFFTFLFNHEPWSRLGANKKNETLSSPGGYTRSCAVFKHTSIFIINHFGEKFSASDNEILKRFGRVFEQSYTRFLDLQKAEAQGQEVQIELSLERIRSQVTAMQESSDLLDIVVAMRTEFVNLGHEAHYFWHMRWLPESYAKAMTSGDGKKIGMVMTLPRHIHGDIDQVANWEKSDETIHVLAMDAETAVDYIHKMITLGDFERVDPQSPTLDDIRAIGGLTFVMARTTHGEIGYSLPGVVPDPSKDAVNTLVRFAGVFDLAYKRFEDLKARERQHREGQIELALERVRARSLAMHNSGELADLSLELVKQVHALGVDTWFCAFNIYDDDPKGSVEWGSNGQGTFPQYRTPREGIFLRYYEAGQNGETLFVNEINKKECPAHYEYLCSLPGVGEQLLQMKDAGIPFPTSQIDHVAFFKYGYLLFITFESVPEAHEIFKRFANVFEQTYTRFLDLQKAEAQTREAKIEAALEKVRSRTMGMQSSEELPEVANVLFLEVQSLGIPAWSCGYNILAEDKKTAICCMSSEGTLQTPFTLRLWGEASFEEMGDFLQSEKTMLVQELGGKALEEHYAHMKSFPDLKPTFDQIDELGLSLPTYQINHLCKFTQGFLLFITYKAVPESHDIFKRFTKVFDQTYTRFLDLKKAENQAREAQIENALEKVRSRSLAMQSPAELIEVAQLLREEMGALGVEELETSSIYIHHEENGTTQCWFTIKNADDPGKAVTDQMTLDLQETWVGRKMMEFYRSPAHHISILMQGENRIEWIRYCEEKSALFSTSSFYGETIPSRTYHLYKFSNGFVGAASPGEISTESWELLKRATNVFSFAYTRFHDLQVAEASASAALRQSSLDRVRADIAAMRSTQDLQRITPLIWQELTNLQVSFIRCGVFIMDEDAQIVHTYLSTADGKDIAAIHLPYTGMSITENAIAHWRKQSVYVDHWDQAGFHQWTKQLIDQGHITSTETYQGGAAPDHLHLHFVPFAQGMLYVGSAHPLPEESIDLIQSLAAAFATAYARYEDFNQLELAKKSTDLALADLEAAKDQLVQQEKLASLGQLTAGIAHEIKNPLNFVNNFSEVSNELLDELLEELEKGNAENVKSISDIIKTNLQKIHEHGSRADSIVKSMLLHSRGGSGHKEPTEINAMVSEYVNLTFHGMRAGKHPINVQIDLQLNETTGQVPLIVEDISRVIINLCNNAFDAMRSKLSDLSQESGYIPRLTVRTKHDGKLVKIEIADNGPGIPDDIKDKILQPFFTTKKGTQGTGLGLSITNDIIKAHGGELTVETKKGEGSEFTISLPSTILS